MNLRFLVVLLLLCPCIQAAFVNACGYGFKCPPYRIVSAADTFEIRHYSKCKSAFPPSDMGEVVRVIALWITWQEHGGITAMTDFAFLVEYTDRVHPPMLSPANSALLYRFSQGTSPATIILGRFWTGRRRCVSMSISSDSIKHGVSPIQFTSKNRYDSHVLKTSSTRKRRAFFRTVSRHLSILCTSMLLKIDTSMFAVYHLSCLTLIYCMPQRSSWQISLS